MPTERLSMRRIRDLLRLKFAQGVIDRAIAGSLGLSKGTVGNYLMRFVRWFHRPTRPLASGSNAPNFPPSASFRPDQPSRKGSLHEWGRLPGRLQSERPEPGPGFAELCHSLLCRSPTVDQCETQPKISAIDCQKNMSDFLTHDDDVRLRSRSGHEACPRKRTRQRVHSARLSRLVRLCCG
jgi:hypothetical protein